jgi:malate synthase
MTETVVIDAPVSPEYAAILTPEAIAFVAALHSKFNARRLELLAMRTARQQLIDSGQFPDFLPETAHIRASDWKVAPIPHDLMDRRT